MPETSDIPMGVCEYCCGTFPANELQHYRIDGRDALLCSEHAAESLRRCSICGSLLREDEGSLIVMSAADDGVVCDGCVDNAEYVSTCDHCGEYFYTDTSDETDSELCPRCFADGYRRCVGCEEVVHGVNEDGYCDSCTDGDNPFSATVVDRDALRWRGVDERSGVLEHFYHPASGWKTYAMDEERKDSKYQLIYLGFELEVDGFSSGTSIKRCAQTLAVPGECFCKHDGSLNGGFELVCYPRTLMSHKKYGWQKKLQQICAAGARSNDTTTCGLHVHVNRDALPDVAWLDVVDSFVNRNRDKLIAFSRRHSQRFSGFDTDLSPENRIAAKRGAYRYTALNFAPKHTREFRIFRGTLSYHTFIATMEFVEALVSYAQRMQCEPCWEALAAYMAKDFPRYAECIDYMQVHELWPAKKSETVDKKEVK